MTRVVLVENDAICRNEIEETLTELGYRVEAHPHGVSALSALGREATIPDLILLDLHTPLMSGAEFRSAQLARPWLERVPVVIVSGDPDVALQAHLLEAVAYLRKPFSLADLLTTISKTHRAR